MMKYLVAFILIFFLLRTVFPSIPTLKNEINLCQREIDFGWKFDEVGDLLISECKEKITVMDIFIAKYLTVSISSNSSFSIMASLINNNGDLLTLTPQNVESSPNLKVLNFDLDRAKQYPKLNRLLTNSKGVKFTVTNVKGYNDLKITKVILR